MSRFKLKTLDYILKSLTMASRLAAARSPPDAARFRPRPSFRPVLVPERKTQRQTASRLPKGRHRSAHYGRISTSPNLKV